MEYIKESLKNLIISIILILSLIISLGISSIFIYFHPKKLLNIEEWNQNKITLKLIIYILIYCYIFTYTHNFIMNKYIEYLIKNNGTITLEPQFSLMFICCGSLALIINYVILKNYKAKTEEIKSKLVEILEKYEIKKCNLKKCKKCKKCIYYQNNDTYKDEYIDKYAKQIKLYKVAKPLIISILIAIIISIGFFAICFYLYYDNILKEILLNN